MGKYKKYFWKVQGTFYFRRVWITGFLGQPKTSLGGLRDRFLQTGVKDSFLWKNGFLCNYKNFLDEPGECAWWSVLSHSREKFFRLKNCFLLKQNKFLGRIFFFWWGKGGGRREFGPGESARRIHFLLLVTVAAKREVGLVERNYV